MTAHTATAPTPAPLGLSRLFGRDGIYVIGSAVPLAAAVVTTPLITRLLAPDAFGTYATSIAINQLLFALLNLGLTLGTTRAYVLHGSGFARRVASLGGAAILALASLVYAGAGTWAPLVGLAGATGVARLTTALSALAALTYSFSAILRCQDRLGLFLLISILQSAAPQVFGIAALAVYPHTAFNFLAASLVPSAGAVLLLLIFVRPRLAHPSFVLQFAAVLRFSLPLIPQLVGTFVINSADRIVVKRVLGDAATGRYQLVYNVATLGVFLLAFVSQAWYPTLQKVTDKRHRDALIRDALRGLLGVTVPICLSLALLGPLLLSIWAPHTFHILRLRYTFAILTSCTLPYAVVVVLNIYFLAFGRSGLVGGLTALSASLNLALNLLLVPDVGLLGSALATGASYLVNAGALLVLWLRESRAITAAQRLVLLEALGVVPLLITVATIPSSGSYVILRFTFGLLAALWGASRLAKLTGIRTTRRSGQSL